jgi:uncharacterized lipoprotein YmbA
VISRASLGWVALAALMACGTSPKTHFFTLAVVPGDAATSSLPFRVQLAAVHLPPTLDRRQLTRMTGEHRVAISETERWAAALDDMVRNVLSQDVAARLPAGTVVLPDAPTPAGTRSLVVTLAQFGPDAGARVQLVGSWALLDPGTNMAVMDRDVRIDAGPAPTADGTADAMSRALGTLGSDIASGLAAGPRASRGGRDATTPSPVR